MTDDKYTKKNLTRMKKVELLAVADAERVNLGTLEKFTKGAIVEAILTQLAGRPSFIPGEVVNRRGLKGVVLDPDVSIRIQRMREQNKTQ